MSDARARLVESIRGAIPGEGRVLDGPFGARRLTYADHAASGRSLGFIEDFIREHVLAFYANTHSETSGTGAQTTRFREDARDIIHAAVGGGPEDVVLFCGAGATAAVRKRIDIPNLRIPADLDALSYARGHAEAPAPGRSVTESELPGYVARAHEVVEEALRDYARLKTDDAPLRAEAERLRWFPPPGEVLEVLTREHSARAQVTPFRLQGT